MIYFVLGIGIALIALVSVILFRAFRFKPDTENSLIIDEVKTDREQAVLSLSDMIKCKTVSSVDRAEEDEAEFIKFKSVLRNHFPKIFESCDFEEVTDRALLFRYKGKHAESPLVLMSHYDVVSADEDKWEKPPFEGIYEDGVLWGRGTLDTKCTLNGVMQAAQRLIEEGFVPENDIYFAFGGNEEIGGSGAPSIVEIFEKRGITPSCVIDEGGAVVENVFPGVSKPCAVIGIGEKGMLNAEFSVSSGGGHASAPQPTTPIGRLSGACVRVESNPFKFRITEPAFKMFDTLARHSTFLYRLIFANLWLFAPILNVICKKKGGELNALVRTTCAFTQMEGSKGMNVIPPFAKMVANLRILPGETVDTAIDHLKKTVNDDQISIRMISGRDPSRISRIDVPEWDALKETIRSTWTDAIVSPYLMVACSDSCHWGKISDKVYRFSPMAISNSQRSTIHGNNERISAEAVVKIVEFYYRLIKKF